MELIHLVFAQTLAVNRKTGKYIIKPVTYTDYNETRKSDGANEKP